MRGVVGVPVFDARADYNHGRGVRQSCDSSNNREDNRCFQASPRDAVNLNATSGLVLHLAADRDDMGCARRVERILHILGNTGIVAEQDASEQ